MLPLDSEWNSGRIISFDRHRFSLQGGDFSVNDMLLQQSENPQYPYFEEQANRSDIVYCSDLLRASEIYTTA